MCGIGKKNCGVEFFHLGNVRFFLNLSKLYSAQFFLIFPVSSFECKEKIFINKIWGHRLSF